MIFIGPPFDCGLRELRFALRSGRKYFRKGIYMGNYLVTGAAGFIGARTAELLIKDGHTVVGVDNLNDAYDPRMKDYRLRRLQALPQFSFYQLDISEKSIIPQLKEQKF